jgi:hypothetical protein
MGVLVREIVDKSRPIRAVYDLIGRVVVTEVPVQILGESGTGKQRKVWLECRPVSSAPRNLSADLSAARHQLEQALHGSDPRRYAEHMATVAGMAQRAERWRTEPLRLPRGVALVAITDDDGNPAHAIEWGRTPPPGPTAAWHDPVVAVELVWTTFMLRRPWAIDDQGLRTLVDRPPVPHACILGDLLSIRFTEWVRQAVVVASQACEYAAEKVEESEVFFRTFARLETRYGARAISVSRQLSDLLVVQEPDSSPVHELSRWRWMLYDYTSALDSKLHERLEVLADRYATAKPKSVGEAWDDLSDRRRLDACTGLVLAHTAMLGPHLGKSVPSRLEDAMSTRVVGSFAWWCCRVMDVWEGQHPLGERLLPDEIEKFMGYARRALERLDTGLWEALRRMFPSIEA